MKFKTEQVVFMPSPCYGVKDYTYIKAFESEDYDQVLKVAKETTMKTEKDTEVWTLKSTVKFPEPDLEVVEETETERT